MDELEKLKLRNQATMEQLYSVIEQNLDHIMSIADGDMTYLDTAMARGLASLVLGFYFQHIAEVEEGQEA